MTLCAARAEIGSLIRRIIEEALQALKVKEEFSINNSLFVLYRIKVAQHSPLIFKVAKNCRRLLMEKLSQFDILAIARARKARATCSWLPTLRGDFISRDSLAPFIFRHKPKLMPSRQLTPKHSPPRPQSSVC